MAIDLINKDVSVFHPYFPLVEQIRSFMSMQGNITFNHCSRESNFCVGVQNNYLLTIWNPCPTDVSFSHLYAIGVEGVTILLQDVHLSLQDDDQ